MAVCSKLRCCIPRRVDPDQAAKAASVTISRYQQALDNFVSWMEKNGAAPQCLEDLDSLVVDYKNDANLSKSQLDYTIASLEWHVPAMKGKLAWSRKVAAGKAGVHETHHTVPLTSAPCKLYAVHLVTQGHVREALGLPLQQALGLRPGELLKLRSRHVMVPDVWNGRYVFRLGAKTGTKVKREQVAFLDGLRFPDLAYLLLMLLESVGPDELLFPFSHSTYGQRLKGVERQIGVQVGATPHSPRAGFASERVALGEDKDQIRDDGRWDSEQSFKMYVDIVGAAQVEAMMRLSAHREALMFVCAHFTSYFPEGIFGKQTHGREGLPQRPRRALLSTGILRPRGPTARAAGSHEHTIIAEEELNAGEVAIAGRSGKPGFGRQLSVVPSKEQPAQGKGKGPGKGVLLKPQVRSSLGR